MTLLGLPMVRNCDFPPPMGKHEIQKQVVLRMFYAALSKDIGKHPDECERQVKNGSIPCDCETIKKYTGFYPWEIDR